MTPAFTNPSVALLAWFVAGFVTGLLAVFPARERKDRRDADPSPP